MMKQPSDMTEEATTVGGGLQALPRREVFITLAGMMLAMFLASLDQTVVGTALPRIIADLGGFDLYTWVTTAYLITSTTVAPIVGKLTDIYGRKWFYVGGIVIFLLGSVLSGLSQNINQLILFRGFQGIGAGAIIASSFTLIGDLFPPAERGKYQGIIASVFGLSSVIGPTLGGFVTDSLSWRWIFYINIPIGIPVVYLFIRFFPNIRLTGVNRRIDFLGVTALVLAVMPLLLALSWGGVQYPWDSMLVIGSLAFAAVMTGLFIWIESRVTEPLMPLEIFRNRIVSISMLAIFLTGFGMFGGIIFIPLFFQGVLGASATTSGSFLTPMMLGMVVGSILSGQVLSRMGGHYRIQGLIGLVIMSIGMALLSRMTVDTTFGQAVRNIVLMGFGLGTTMPLFVIAVQNAVPYRVLGVATTSTQFVRSIGGTLGLAILGSVMANRFASTFTTELPATVRGALPPERLADLASNPQILVSPDAQAQLQAGFSQFGPQGEAMFQQLITVMRQSLVFAVAEVFFIGLIVVAVAWLVTLFLKEVPLRKDHQLDSEAEEVLEG
ncbi:MAG: MDR family MFS transporter [Candidatus Bipolaricaulia bacterium]